ncbi:MAG: ATP-binding protein [Desulfurivibrionaceae bacterium]|jgi:PAS domain S-box-containing protein
MRILKSTIAGKLILSLLGCSLLLIIASTALRFYYDYTREMHRLSERLQEIEDSSSPVMSDNIWLANWEMVQLQAQGIQRLPEIHRVEVVVDGREIAAIGPEAQKEGLRYVIPLVHRYKDRNVSLGTLTLYGDEKSIRQRLLGEVFVEMSLRFVVILIIASILFLLFHRLVGRHLIAMATQLRDLDQMSLKTQLVLDKKTAGSGGMDEIDQLLISFNEMQQNLQHSFAELRQTNEELARENRERLKVDEELRENRTMLRNILDAVPQAIFWKDQQSVYLGCNQVFARAAGLDDPQQIVGKTDYDLPWPKNEAEAYRADDQEVVINRRSKRHIIEPLQQADGTRLWIDTTKIPLLDGQNHPYGVLGVYDDISERIRAEEEKKKLESQLRQSQKMEAIGTLAGGIAHDFNNILAIILGYAELTLFETSETDPRRNKIEEIITASNRAKDLVRQILDFSRKSEKMKEPLLLAPLLKETLKMVRASIPATIAIEERITAVGSTVLADPSQMHQVIINLCTNAFHAMEEHGGILSITLDSVQLEEEDAASLGGAAGNYVRLIVADSGCGMSPSIKRRIFEPYFTTKGVGKGSGMGLAVVHGILRSHGGLLRLTSQEGKGSSFEVFLPAIDQQVKAKTEKEGVFCPPGTERILVVDDEPAITDMVCQWLAQLGYTVTTSNNSVAALTMVRENPSGFDLIITDQSMPFMPGAELAKEILEVRPDLPIILCTGYSSTLTEEKAKEIGIRSYAYKPLQGSELARLVRQALDDKRD